METLLVVFHKRPKGVKRGLATSRVLHNIFIATGEPPPLMKYSPDKMYREIVVKIMEVKAAEINPLLNQWHGNYICISLWIIHCATKVL